MLNQLENPSDFEPGRVWGKKTRQRGSQTGKWVQKHHFLPVFYLPNPSDGEIRAGGTPKSRFLDPGFDEITLGIMLFGPLFGPPFSVILTSFFAHSDLIFRQISLDIMLFWHQFPLFVPSPLARSRRGDPGVAHGLRKPVLLGGFANYWLPVSSGLPDMLSRRLCSS